MALYALASAKGSPGVSIAAMALAGTWPTDPVVADLDPAGGDFTWRYRTVHRRARSTPTAACSPSARPYDAAPRRPTSPTTSRRSGRASGVLAGLASPGRRSRASVRRGASCPRCSRAADHDVLADCGRVVPGVRGTPVCTPPTPCCSSRARTVEGTAHLRERLQAGSADQLGLGGADGVPVGVAS